MKKIGVHTFALTLFFILVTFSITSAEIRSKALNFNTMAGGYSFDDDRVLLDLGKMFTLGLGYNFTQNIGTELSASYIHTDADIAGDSDIYAFQPRLDFFYNIMPDNDIVPYVIGGVGGLFFESDNIQLEDTVQVNGGLGIKYFIADNLALRADGRYYHGFEDADNEFALTAGIVFQIGGKPKDSDKDGVPDEKDKCSNTPLGAEVDTYGCRDTDQDGVLNTVDKCPDTPQGTEVDNFGCPKIDPYAVMEKTSDDAQALEESDKELVVEKKVIPEMMEVVIFFEFDEVKIKSIYHDRLERLAELMKKHPEIKANIEGHTDSIGSEKYNEKLSQQRAESVKNYIIENFGIDYGRFELQAFGESKPAASNNTSKGRTENRRAITITIIE